MRLKCRRRQATGGFPPSLRPRLRGGRTSGCRAGELGDVYLLRAAQRDMAPPRPEFLAGSGGIFVDMGIHDFDAARWLVGEVASSAPTAPPCPIPALPRSATSTRRSSSLRSQSGALGVLDISRVAGYGYDSSAELVGSRATVRVDEPFVHGYEWRTPGCAGRPLVQTFDHRYAGAFAAELEQFARSIIDDTPPLVTGADALACVRPGPGRRQILPARPAGEHGARPR